MRADLGAAVGPAEERLGRLVKLLRREELLAYADWDEPGASRRAAASPFFWQILKPSGINNKGRLPGCGIFAGFGGRP